MFFLISGMSFISWMFRSLVSVALFEYYQSMMALGLLVESASACQWVRERNRDGIGERRLREAKEKI